MHIDHTCVMEWVAIGWTTGIRSRVEAEYCIFQHVQARSVVNSACFQYWAFHSWDEVAERGADYSPPRKVKTS
jgi:hypothetical protein